MGRGGRLKELLQCWGTCYGKTHKGENEEGLTASG